MPVRRSRSQTERAEEFGALVRRLRRRAAISQRDLAAQLPMSPTNLSRIELGSQGPPGNEVIERLAAVLGVEPDVLFRAAGRLYPAGPAFEERVLAELREMRGELNQVRRALDRVESTLAAGPPPQPSNAR